MKLKLWSLAVCLTALSAQFSQVRAEPVWIGNFETGDLSQWHNALNPQGISLTQSCVHSGQYAGQVRITDEDSFNWFGNKALNRSEFHHRLPAGATYEGKETFFSFYFYLPEAWSQAKHELGYWESDKSWQQMFRFNIRGEQLSFQQSSAAKSFWSIADGATARQWHRLALHIHWSTNPNKGFVDTWADGQAMGRQVFQTLYAPEALMFTQIGVLRTQEATTERIIIDDAVEATNLTALAPEQYQPEGMGCQQPQT